MKRRVFVYLKKQLNFFKDSSANKSNKIFNHLYLSRDFEEPYSNDYKFLFVSNYAHRK